MPIDCQTNKTKTFLALSLERPLSKGLSDKFTQQENPQPVVMETKVSQVKTSQNRSQALVFALFLLIGLVTIISFFINLRAMLLLKSAFVEGATWSTDFERITRFMLARIVSPLDGTVASFHDMDFFKLTALYTRNNNNIVLVLALIEVAGVNILRQLRHQSKLRISATIFFAIMALASPVIYRLSESYAGF